MKSTHRRGLGSEGNRPGHSAISNQLSAQLAAIAARTLPQQSTLLSAQGAQASGPPQGRRTTLRTVVDIVPVAVVGTLELSWLVQSLGTTIAAALNHGGPWLLMVVEFAHRAASLTTLVHTAGARLIG
jgi:hypothetical protein